MAAILALVATLTACSHAAGAAEANATEAAAVPAAGMRRVDFAVEGMTCGACAAATRIVLERLPGVRDAGANYEQGMGRAWAVYDPARATPAEMARAIETLHFRPTRLQE